MSLEDVKIRQQYVKDGWLRSQKLDDLEIFTYTQKTVYEKSWNPITINSRGHIFNVRTGQCVAQPFAKFFNVDERPDDQPDLWGSCKVFEKLDGWLGTLYRHNRQYKIATRGSFKSIGAVWATSFLQNYNLENLGNDITLVFELIHPSLRKESNLVVNYGDREDLVLLGVFNCRNKEELPWLEVERIASRYGFSIPKVYEGWSSYNAITLAKTLGVNEEGFVLRYSNGMRLKVKGAEYVKAARAIRLLTPMNLWKNMHSGEVYDAFLDIFPDDFKGKATSIAYQLELGYAEIEEQARHDFYIISSQGYKNRRDFAELAKKSKYTSVLFCLLDNEDKKFDNCIMQRLRERIKNEKM